MLSTLAVPALVATVAAFVPASADAQDYTSGAIIGTVTDAKGAPVAGAAVSLTSKAQGQTRTLTSDANGRFTATGLPAGEYDVTVTANGYTQYKGTASIVVAQETKISYALQEVGSTQTVVVRGHRARQDFTKTTTGLTVDLDTLTSQEPIARSITAVTMLAPTAVHGVQGFGDVPSLGGSSVAENAYYINGLNITNPDTYVGSAKVPFDFYKTVQVQTGGYAAEFGRATGGVINAVSKSGTNEFMFAVHGNYAPQDWAGTSPDTATDVGKDTKTGDEELSFEVGGPIIKDHLFAYGMYEANRHSSTEGEEAGVYETKKATDPFYGAKIDGYITPTQHLELTYFTTKTTTYANDYTYDPSTGAVGDFTGLEKLQTGGENWVAKYTGKVTDWFTLSGAYGISKDANDTLPDDPTAYYVLDFRSSTTSQHDGNFVQLSKQPFQQNEVDDTERKFYRIDGDMVFNVWGHHHVRFGLDNEDNSETKVLANNGALPIYIRYDDTGIRYRYERLGGAVSGKDDAFYIQDSWDVTQNLNLQIGIRDDEFEQSNLSGQKYLSLKNNWGPRIGFSWDPTGEQKFKIFGNFGVYYIPPAMNMGFRGKDLYFQEYFAYPTGTTAADAAAYQPGADGLPTTVGAARDGKAGSSSCPVDLSAAPGHPVNSDSACGIFGAGIQDPAIAKLAIGTKASHENEFILGGSWKIDDLWSVGVTASYRQLKEVSEDTDFAPILYNHYQCGAAGQTASDAACDWYGNNSAYYIWNPGKKTQTLVDWYGALSGQKNLVTLTAADLPFSKPKRAYQALVFDFKRAFDGKWGIQGSLTLSKSWGSTEGTVKSDAGVSAQDDAGSTQDFDYYGLTEYNSGLLPNHHGYVFKTWGSYALTPDFLVGAAAMLQSPMHGSCEGISPDDPIAAQYGASSFFCSGIPTGRGKGFKTDWVKNIDLSMRYTVPEHYAMGGKLVLRADIFNLFDGKAVLERYNQHDLGPDPTSQNDPNYLQPTYYQQPRYVRIGFDLTY